MLKSFELFKAMPKVSKLVVTLRPINYNVLES